MEIADETRQGLNIALNESVLLGFEINPYLCLAGATFNVLTLPEVGPPPGDRRVQILFVQVGRVAASFWLRESLESQWRVKKFKIEDLLTVVEEVKAPIRGWNFFDIEEKTLKPFEKRLRACLEIENLHEIYEKGTAPNGMKLSSKTCAEKLLA